MEVNNQMTAMARFKRWCFYAAIAVIASVAMVFTLSTLENPTKPPSRVIGTASYVLGVPLGLGALISFGIFGAPGSCANSTQILAIFLIPFMSFPIDAGLIFVVREYFHRKASRGLDANGILHIE
jgi:hypothetical protein